MVSSCDAAGMHFQCTEANLSFTLPWDRIREYQEEDMGQVTGVDQGRLLLKCRIWIQHNSIRLAPFVPAGPTIIEEPPIFDNNQTLSPISSGREFYLCLVSSKCLEGQTPAFKFMDASIVSSEREAKEVATERARLAYPQHADLEVDVTAYSFRHSILEQAATEILGWRPPTPR